MSTQAQSQAGGVGSILKQSREQRGLTTAEVASQLRLKVSLIEQIEAEQWDPAVSATFIRGYLRAYAKLLKLPEKEILANFELQAAFLRHQTKPMHSFSNKASLDAVDNRFMLASYLLIVLLIGLFLVWFWQTHLLDAEPVTALPELSVSSTEAETSPAKTETTETTVASTEVPAATIPQPEQAELTGVATADTKPVVADSVTADSTTPATADSTTPATAEPQQVEVATAAPVAANSDTAVNNVGSEVATADNSAETTAQDAAASEQTPAAAGNATITLQFSAECWLEITDASGKRLAYGTRQAGQTERLTGTAPFKVLLGNAAAAKVQLNDVAVDLSGYAAGRVARLTLGGQP